MSTNIGKSIDFDVVREPWQKYELNDNTIIKTKFVLTKLFKKIKEDNKPAYTIDGQNITVVLAPQEVKGQPDSKKYTPQEYQKSIIQEDVKYNTISDEWYEYIVDDGTRIRMKATITGIHKTDKFDTNGDRVYLINHNALLQIKLPKLE
ncbi:MAG: hypothetical protein IIA83_12655 [Thaumarchaeota archaeon]|nr:hypothetical protein [Nitrososphaerota archaeon]